MINHPLAGVYAASVTPLRADFSVDLDAIPAYQGFLAGRGCHGALLLGTTGEGPSFSPEERLAIFQAALEVRDTYPNFKLLAGTGTPSLTETIDLNRAAFDMGFDGVVCLPPYYFRKAGDAGLYTWFEQVIQKSVPADKYLLGYHIPATAGVGFSIQLLAKLKDAFPIQFAGIKDSSHDPDLARNLGDLFGDEMLILNGTDSYLQLALENQAGGCITAPANLISQHLRAVWDAFAQDRDALSAQARVSELRHILEKYMPFPPVLKALLPRLHNQPRWAVRPPLTALSAELEEKAYEEFSAAEQK